MSDYLNPHPPGCPWHDVTEVVGSPNLKWCEPSRCDWISEPANTWSNVGYLAVAVVFWRLARSARHAAVRLFTPTAFLMGLLSFVYHASNNYLSQVLDFVGMFLYLYLLVCINLVRVWPALRPRRRWIYWSLILINLAAVHAMYRAHLPFQGLIALAVLALVVTEVVCLRRGDGQRYRYRHFWSALALIVMAETFSLLDLTRVWCQPGNGVLHGHAIWHLLGALSLLFAFLHYRQLAPDEV